MYTNSDDFFEQNPPTKSDDGQTTLLRDVFAFSRMFANDRVGKSSIEVRPSYLSSLYSIPPYVAISLTPQMAQHLHEWFSDHATRDDFSFSFPPEFDLVSEDKFLSHVND